MQSQWPQIIKDLMKEQHVSGRKLCVAAGVNRNVFCNYLAGRSTYFSIEKYEKILAVFGYELEAIKVAEEE